MDHEDIRQRFAALTAAHLADACIVRVAGVRGLEPELNPTLSVISGVPVWIAVPAIGMMASLVSPLSEEAGFRGYGQVLIERRYPAIVAVTTSSSLFFALYHGPTQGFAPSKVGFYFVVGLVFGSTAWITKSTLPALPVHIVGASCSSFSFGRTTHRAPLSGRTAPTSLSVFHWPAWGCC